MLEIVVYNFGWGFVEVVGLGSLIGVVFEDGFVLDSYVIEFLIIDVCVGFDVFMLEIVIVGIDGSKIMSGWFVWGENVILVIVELVLCCIS